MLEVKRQQVPCEFCWLPHYEAARQGGEWGDGGWGSPASGIDELAGANQQHAGTPHASSIGQECKPTRNNHARNTASGSVLWRPPNGRAPLAGGPPRDNGIGTWIIHQLIPAMRTCGAQRAGPENFLERAGLRTVSGISLYLYTVPPDLRLAQEWRRLTSLLLAALHFAKVSVSRHDNCVRPLHNGTKKVGAVIFQRRVSPRCCPDCNPWRVAVPHHLFGFTPSSSPSAREQSVCAEVQQKFPKIQK